MVGRPTENQAQVRLRLMQDGQIALGPGKVTLLEAIVDAGSISRAARQLGMSYKRAWDLVSIMNSTFSEALVETSTGGGQGGGARVTATGLQVIRLYRRAEQDMLMSQSGLLQELGSLLRDPMNTEPPP